MKKIYILSLFLFCYVASFAQKFDEQVKSLTESITRTVEIDTRKFDSCAAVVEAHIAKYNDMPVNVKNATELSVLHGVAGWMYNQLSSPFADYRNADVDYSAKSKEHWGHLLDNKEMLAMASAKDYKVLVELGVDGEAFNHDMLYVMYDLYMNSMNIEGKNRYKYLNELKSLYKRLGRKKGVEVLDDVMTYYAIKDSVLPDNRDSRLLFWRECRKKYAKSRFVNEYINMEMAAIQPSVTYNVKARNSFIADKPFDVVVSYWNSKSASLTIREYVGETNSLFRWEQKPKETGKIVKRLDFFFGNDEANRKRKKDNLPVMGKDSVSTSLPAGKYVLVFKSNGEKSVQTVEISSMKLATVNDGENLRCYVLDANTGKPVNGIKVTCKERMNDGSILFLDSHVSDTNGEVIFGKVFYSPSNLIISAYRDKCDSTVLNVYCFNKMDVNPKTRNKVNFFLDRKIYRPGQTVHVGGVVYRETSKDKFDVQGDYKLNIKCESTGRNRQQIFKRELNTNSFGSFDFSFTLPADAEVGEYVISCGDGSITYKVEEYKRPEWELSLGHKKNDGSNMDESATIGDTVIVEGMARTYSGVPVQSANVEYRLERTYQFHRWWYYSSDKGEVYGNGNVKTDNDGKFYIKLPLVVEKDDVPCTCFKVYAKVTDSAGETHEEEYSIRVFKDGLAVFFEGGSVIDLNNEKDVVVKAVDALKNNIATDVNCTLLLNGKEVAQKTMPSNQPFKLSSMFAESSIVPMGTYKLKMTVAGMNGKEIVNTSESFNVFDSNINTANGRKADFAEDFFYVPCDTIKGNSPQVAYFCPADDDVMVFKFQGHNGNITSRILSLYSRKMNVINVNPCDSTEDYTALMMFYVKDGKQHLFNHCFVRELPDMRLSVSWKTFRDRLEPGGKETWTLLIKDKDGKRMNNAEVLATMYDASLDAYAPNVWGIGRLATRNNNVIGIKWDYWERTLYSYHSKKVNFLKEREYNFDKMPIFLGIQSCGVQLFPVGAVLEGRISGLDIKSSRKSRANVAPKLMAATANVETAVVSSAAPVDYETEESAVETPISSPLRSNFAETAFFYPHLVTDKNGEVEISFTLPESLTKWKFLGFAHDKEMNNGVITAEAVAQKTFMVQPQMPRFIRVGDEAMIPVRIINQGDKSIMGMVQMRILNARTEEAIKSLTQTQTFSCGADTTIVVTFPITATSSADDYICEVVAEGNVKGEEIKGAKGLNSKVKGSKDSSLFTLHSSFSDGERNLLPVLPSRVKLTESVPFYIDNASEKTIDLSKVYNGNSSTAEEKTMSIEYTANPVWTVVEALRQIDTPESPSAPSLAASVYANSMLLALDTKFSAYTQKPVINRDTVGVKLTKAMKELRNLQCKDGGFRWFSGFERSSYYITLLVAEQLVKAPLPPKGAAVQNSGDVQELKGSKGSVIGKDTNALTRKDAPFGGWGALLSYLDSIQVERYEFNRANKIKTVPSESDFHYLYVCSMTPERKVSSKAKALRNEMLSYIETHSQELSIYGLSASSNILRAFGRKSSADKFLNVVRHYLVKDEGLGKHFESNRAQYSWYDYRIPTQVAAMEAFYAVNPKDDNLNDMTLWLLRQKQVQSWDNPANTVNVCDLLLKMNDSAISSALLSHDSSLPRMSLNGKQLTDKSFVKDNVKKDSLYFAEEIGYMNKQVSASLAENAKTLKIQKNNGSKVQGTSNSSISWGAVTVTFTEENNKLNSYTTGEVRISRRIMVEDNSSTLPKWRDLSEGETLKVGQKVRVRHTLHTDRDMDYVCVKTLHPACFEPVDKLSGYQWKGGEGCYQSIHDSYIEMFFQTYHEGTSTLDIDYYVTRPGTYNMGITTAECTYAPMYGGHSDGMTVKVVGN